MIEFFVPCTPPSITAQQRRHKYKQAALKKAEAFWKAVMEQNAPKEPLDGALWLELMIVYPHTKGSRELCDALDLMAIPRTVKVDCDNINKIPQDAMAKCGYFVNDSRIYHLEVEKWFGDMPGVHVKLYRDPKWINIIK